MLSVTEFTPCWFVVPAAGVGSRMQAECPKQYLKIQQKTILEYTLERLLSYGGTQGVVVALQDGDTYWPHLPISQNARIHSIVGGAERANSVLAGLDYLQNILDDNAWVLVHDAARPCLAREDLSKLISALAQDAVGGILGIPVSDTLKQVTNKEIQHTVDRQRLWQAQTPQMFRLGLLQKALKSGLMKSLSITDEASAIELFGYHPKIIEGSTQNIKITRPSDLALAEFILSQQKLV